MGGTPLTPLGTTDLARGKEIGKVRDVASLESARSARVTVGLLGLISKALLISLVSGQALID